MALTSASSAAPWMKAREVTTRRTLPVSMAVTRPRAPAVKFSIAVWRPREAQASKVTTVAAVLGNNTPTRSRSAELARERAAQHQRAGQEIAIAKARAGGVLQHALRHAMVATGAHHRREQRLVVKGGRVADLQHGGQQRIGGARPPLAATRLGWHREAARRQHRQGDGRQAALPHLAAQAREMRILRTVDRDRQELGLGVLGDECRAFVDFHQRRAGRHAAFGKDHERAAVTQQVGERLDGAGVQGVEFVPVDETQQRAHPRSARGGGTDGEHRLERQEQVEQQAVDERGVIGHQHDARTGRAQVLEAAHLDPAQHPQQGGGAGAQQARGQGRPARMHHGAGIAGHGTRRGMGRATAAALRFRR
jgi:hypothetical protein